MTSPSDPLQAAPARAYAPVPLLGEDCHGRCDLNVCQLLVAVPRALAVWHLVAVWLVGI